MRGTIGQRNNYGTRFPKRRGSTVGVFAGIIALIVGGLIALWVVAVKSTQRHVTFKVTDKAVKYDHDHNGGKSQYLVYTNHGTYKDTDSLLYLKFSSSDLYGKLQRGHRYTCKVVGWRIPLFSEYPNLVNCKDAS